jgi:hypothetical protein
MTDSPAEQSANEYSDEERRWLLRLAHLSIRAAVLQQPLAAEAGCPTFAAAFAAKVGKQSSQ